MPTNPVNTGLIDASPVVLNASATIYPDDRLGTLALIDSLPPGASVDNIFYFSINSEYYRRIIDAPMSAAYCGIYADGTDQTSNFSAAFSAGVKTIAFDDPAGAVFVINGTLAVPDGIIFQFHEGNMLGGTGTVTGGIIDASMYQQIFGTSLTVTPQATTTGRLSVMWFGAETNTGANAQPAIQACVDAALRGQKHGTVYLPKGGYTIHKGIIIQKVYDPLQSPFASVDIIGEKHSFTDGEGDGAETIIGITNPEDFCIGVQKGKGVTIQNLAFTGKNVAGASISPLAVSNPETSWLTTSVRNDPTSPHAAIVIDPFGSSSIPGSGGRYPCWEEKYIETDAGGSTDVKVLDCFIRGFAVGIMNSPNGYTQNAETMLFQNIWFYSCYVGIANGQDQARTVICNNTKFWDGIQCCFDCRRYGIGSRGSAMIVDGVKLVYWLM